MMKLHNIMKLENNKTIIQRYDPNTREYKPIISTLKKKKRKNKVFKPKGS